MSYNESTETIWNALHSYRESAKWSESDDDEEWQEICEAMEDIANACNSSAMQQELEDSYDGEHPKYTLADWREAVMTGDVTNSYWNWVFCELQLRGEGIHDHLPNRG